MRKITNPIVIGIVRRCKPITLLLTTCGTAACPNPIITYIGEDRV